MRRVLILTWEFPPRIVSHISHTVESWVKFLEDSDYDIDVIAYDDWRAGIVDEVNSNARVHHVGTNIKAVTDPLMWVLTISNEMERVASDMMHNKKFDLVHAHEWITFPSAMSLKKAFRNPLVITYHSIESNRTYGLSDPYIEAIKKIEWQAQFEADSVIMHDILLANQVVENYQTPWDKIMLIQKPDSSPKERFLEAYDKVIKNGPKSTAP